jgi:hypothetical protein
LIDQACHSEDWPISIIPLSDVSPNGSFEEVASQLEPPTARWLLQSDRFVQNDELGVRLTTISCGGRREGERGEENGGELPRVQHDRIVVALQIRHVFKSVNHKVVICVLVGRENMGCLGGVVWEYDSLPQEVVDVPFAIPRFA